LPPSRLEEIPSSVLDGATQPAVGSIKVRPDRALYGRTACRLPICLGTAICLKFMLADNCQSIAW
jgi:hypothetical protein